MRAVCGSRSTDALVICGAYSVCMWEQVVCVFIASVRGIRRERSPAAPAATHAYTRVSPGAGHLAPRRRTA